MKLLETTRLWRGVLSAMMVVLGLVGFWPTPIDQPVHKQIAEVLFFLHAHGFPRWFNYTFVEAASNVVLFIPLGIVASLAFPAKRWWQVSAFGLMVSGCMELGQQLFLHDRFSSPVDVVTNTSGTVIGVVLATATRRLLQKKQAQRFSALSLSKTGL